MFENVKKKSRDDLSNRSIVVGSEVRTRAIPIYASFFIKRFSKKQQSRRFRRLQNNSTSFL